MQIREILARHRTTFSFEFFPPKTPEAGQLLLERAAELARLHPSFVSVTYGAGGSTRDRTREVVVRLATELSLPAAAHLTCVGHTRSELTELLENYRARGIENIVALRGDRPENGGDFQPAADGLTYASELVELIRDRFGQDFSVAVAGYPEGHPETPSRIADLDHLKRKVDAGADVVITQLFFDNRDFYDFRERCELAGIEVPILAGIMPIASRKGIMRMASLCGARLPARLIRRLNQAGDDDKVVSDIGVDWATQQCRDLLDNQVRGIHLYTLNRCNATVEIYRRLGAEDSEALERLAHG
ncbi:MAG: methylenetetrahydrofolate reductase [NAD(P)H] [Phycisphaerae bacterium]|nr:methylenetetrahydrofolate reductase [NAD(P)H] [Phycisphaerae bacterium]